MFQLKIFKYRKGRFSGNSWGNFFGLGNVLIRKTTGITSLLKTFHFFWNIFSGSCIFINK